MRGFSKLGITLTSVFSLLLLALLAEILYLLWRRRKQTRVGPTGSRPGPTTESLKLDAGLYGPHSRALFTIKEEEAETECSSVVEGGERKTRVTLGEHFGDFQFDVADGDSLPEMAVLVDSEVEPPFLTPCASPPYYTPASSPSRERK